MFQGKIIVRHGAQKTDARMMTRALLLSETPRPTTSRNWKFSPTTCSAATARPPARSTTTLKFYLMARGIPRAEAEALLILSFVAEAIEEVRHEGAPRRAHGRDPGLARRATGRNERHAPRGDQRWLRRRESARGLPILAMPVYGKPLVYLDNAASAQKPRAVLDRIQQAYTSEYANVHRGLHFLANAATEAYEGAREKVRGFLNAERAEEIIFTRNATEAINLVAYTFGRERIKPGDEIVLSIMEHHSNIVPWHFLRERQGAVIKWAPVDDDGNFLIDEFEKLLTDRTRMVAITHMSNMLGTVVPVKEVVRIAHARGIPVLIDGAQGAVHLDVDVRDIDADFYVFTGHKLYGPTGIGVLYGKYAHLAAMPPFNGGGEMIREVSEDRVTYGDPPHKFEAGTPSIVQAIGLGAAIDYVNSLGRDAHPHPRARAARLCDGSAARDQFAENPRHGARQGCDRLVRDEGRASPRRRHHHRPFRRCGARRHPLRDAAACPLRRDRELPRFVRPLQHPRGGRQPRERTAQSTGILRMSDPVDTPTPTVSRLRERRLRRRPARPCRPLP